MVGANIAYDFACLAAQWPELLPAIWEKYARQQVRDVQIRATLVAIAEGRLQDGGLSDKRGSQMRDSKGRVTNRYSLDVCVREWLGRDDAKQNDEWRLRYAELDGVPVGQWPEAAKQYPIDDAVNTLAVAFAQEGSTGEGDEHTQVWAALCCHLGAAWGIRADGPRVEALAKDLEARMADDTAWAKSAGFVRSEGSKAGSKDTARIKAAVTAAYMGNPPLTEKGGVSTSRETLADSGDPTLEKLSEISKTAKLVTYLPTLRAAASTPLNIKPNVLLATGRVSYTGLIQLLPRSGGIRECFLGRGILSSCDYAAIELSTLAQVCLWSVGKSALADAINDGLDPHSYMAAKMTGQSYAEFMAKIAAKDKDAKNLRQAAKSCFGADTLVATKRGAVRIVDVLGSDLLWDGCDWVPHEGVIDQGERETWRLQGVNVTPEHAVLTGLGWRGASEALTSRSLFRSALSLANSQSLNGGGSSTARSQQGFRAGVAASVVTSSSSPASSFRVVTQRGVSTATSSRSVPARTRNSMPQLRSQKLVAGSLCVSLRACHDARTPPTRTTPTMEAEVFACGRSGLRTERISFGTAWGYLDGTTARCSSTASTTTRATSLGTCASYQQRRMWPIDATSVNWSNASQSLRQRLRVYDISNAGPRHRFCVITQAGPIIVSNCNFGYPGMMGPCKFVIAQRRTGSSVCEWLHADGRCGEQKSTSFKGRDYGVPLCCRCVAEATRLREYYLATWTEIPAYWDWVGAQIQGSDSITQFVSGRVRGGLSAPQAANTLFQGLAADGAKRALIQMTQEMYVDKSSPLYGSRLFAFAHDETLVDLPHTDPDRLHAAASRQAEVMIKGMRTVCPDVKVKAEPALMTRWSKEADTVKDAQGRYTVWEPKQ